MTTSHAPTAAYRRHHDVEAPQVDAAAFRQGWQVRTRLDALADDGSITEDEWRAACDYRDHCDRVSAGPAGPGFVRTSGGADAHERQTALAVVQARLRAVDARLGPRRVALLWAVVVLDRSWRDVGRAYGCDRETARRAAVAVLRALGFICPGGRLPRNGGRRVDPL